MYSFCWQLIFIQMLMLIVSDKRSIADCPKVYSPRSTMKQRGDLCYLFVLKEMDWNHAQKSCHDNGGSLVVIPDSATQNFLVSTLRSLRWPYNGVSIGATDKVREGHWMWDNGVPVNYSNWAAGQISSGGFLFNDGLNQNEKEDCSQIRLDNGGRWSDFPCDRSGIFGFFNAYSYICQFAAQNNHTSFQTSANFITGKSNVVSTRIMQSSTTTKTPTTKLLHLTTTSRPTTSQKMTSSKIMTLPKLSQTPITMMISTPKVTTAVMTPKFGSTITTKTTVKTSTTQKFPVTIGTKSISTLQTTSTIRTTVTPTRVKMTKTTSDLTQKTNSLIRTTASATPNLTPTVTSASIRTSANPTQMITSTIKTASKPTQATMIKTTSNLTVTQNTNSVTKTTSDLTLTQNTNSAIRTTAGTTQHLTPTDKTTGIPAKNSISTTKTISKSNGFSRPSFIHPSWKTSQTNKKISTSFSTNQKTKRLASMFTTLSTTKTRISSLPWQPVTRSRGQPTTVLVTKPEAGQHNNKINASSSMTSSRSTDPDTPSPTRANEDNLSTNRIISTHHSSQILTTSIPTSRALHSTTSSTSTAVTPRGRGGSSNTESQRTSAKNRNVYPTEKPEHSFQQNGVFSSKVLDEGAIVGIVLGGIAGIVIVVLLIAVVRKTNESRAKLKSLYADLDVTFENYTYGIAVIGSPNEDICVLTGNQISTQA